MVSARSLLFVAAIAIPARAFAQHDHGGEAHAHKTSLSAQQFVGAYHGSAVRF
jgi:hypothetical protein